jgi:Ca-activated chloride channel family protein
VVVFDDEAPQVLIPAQAATDIPMLQNLVEGLQEQGGTAMSRGLEAGLAELQKHHDPARLNRVLLLTDGQTWGDEDACRALAQQLGQLGVPITALGLGDEWNEKLLDDLYDLAKRLDDRLCSIERIMTAENPNWRQQCLPDATARIEEELTEVRSRGSTRARVRTGE